VAVLLKRKAEAAAWELWGLRARDFSLTLTDWANLCRASGAVERCKSWRKDPGVNLTLGSPGATI